MQRFAIRTVKNGTVKIGGQIMRPKEYFAERDGWACAMPYRGQLDGMRLAFGRYWTAGECENFVWLWGTEERYQADTLEDFGPEPNCINGYFYWDWWYTEEKWQKDQAIWRTCGFLPAAETSKAVVNGD